MSDEKKGGRAGPNDPTRLIIRANDSAPTQILGQDDTRPLGKPGRELAGTVIGVAPSSDTRPLPRDAAAQPATVLFQQPGQPEMDSTKLKFDPVVAWLVVHAGPGRGQFRPVYYGQNSIGRAASQRISIDLGDEKISREEHAYLVYDERERRFFIRDGGKANLVRCNGAPVMTPTELKAGDRITIGDTTLHFVPYCGTHFDWLTDEPAKA